MGKYRFRVDMFSSETDEYIKSMNAYTTEARANKACDSLNAEASKDPVYGRVYYDVIGE